MANSKILLSDLKSDNCSSRVQVRLLRFWEAGYVRRGGELMSVHMLLPDSKPLFPFYGVSPAQSFFSKKAPARSPATYGIAVSLVMNLAVAIFNTLLLLSLREMITKQRESSEDIESFVWLWEGGELLDIILSRGGKYKEEDAKFVMIQILVFC
ncbi:hypothetical protein YC2023_118655 [Brassica napus]